MPELPVASQVLDVPADPLEIDEEINLKLGFRNFCCNNCCAFAYNAVVCVFIGLMAWVAIAFQDQTLALVPLGVMVFISCVIYLGHALDVHDFHKGSWKTRTEAVEFLRKVADSTPQLNQEIRCFHAENTKNSVQSEITTFRKTIPKEFTDWYDISPIQEVNLHGTTARQDSLNSLAVSQVNESRLPQGRGVKKLIIDMTYLTASAATKSNFDEQKQQMIDTYKSKDKEYQYTESYFVPDIPKVIMVRRENAGFLSNIIFSSHTFLCCTLCACSFFYRCVLETFCIDSQVWSSKKVLSTDTFEGATTDLEPLAVVTVVDEEEGPLETFEVDVDVADRLDV